MRTLEDVTKEVAKILGALGIEYAIVGGVAVAGWGNLRTTRDVDVVIDLQSDRVKEFVRAFKKRGFSIGEQDVLDALKEKGHFTIFDNRSVYHVDAKGAYGGRELKTIETRKKTRIKGSDAYIASAEDTIANKLVFGSEQDLRDAEGIFIRQAGRLDLKYLERICKAMGVGKELAGLKRAARGASGSRGRRRF
ncbi:MAG: DUF6036 family nucleotidyltransferase [Candidatus Hadarchaeota archaeon]